MNINLDDRSSNQIDKCDMNVVVNCCVCVIIMIMMITVYVPEILNRIQNRHHALSLHTHTHSLSNWLHSVLFCFVLFFGDTANLLRHPMNSQQNQNHVLILLSDHVLSVGRARAHAHGIFGGCRHTATHTTGSKTSIDFY